MSTEKNNKIGPRYPYLWQMPIEIHRRLSIIAAATHRPLTELIAEAVVAYYRMDVPESVSESEPSAVEPPAASETPKQD